MERLLSSLLEDKKKGEQIELFATHHREEYASLVQDRLKELARKESQAVGVRVKKSGRIGFASTTDFSKAKEALTQARTLSVHSPKSSFSFPRKRVLPQEKMSSSFPGPNAREMVKLAVSAREKVKATFANAQVDVKLSRAQTSHTILNSFGLLGSFVKCVYVKMVSAVFVEDGLLQLYEAEAGTDPRKVFQAPVEDRLIEKLKQARRVHRLKETVQWVIFSPKAVEHLLSPLKMALSGKFIAKKISPLTGRLNQKIFDDALTITDDPTLTEGLNSQPFDGEGIPTRKLTLLKNGTLKHFLLDLKTAAELHQKSNGRAIRTAFTQPVPGATNWVIAPGSAPLSEILNDGLCLLIDQGIGWAGNPLSGSIAFNVEVGFLWKNGSCLGRCKDVMVSGNIYQALEKELFLSREREWSYGEFYTPYIGVQKLTCIQGG